MPVVLHIPPSVGSHACPAGTSEKYEWFFSLFYFFDDKTDVGKLRMPQQLTDDPYRQEATAGRAFVYMFDQPDVPARSHFPPCCF